ncbi:MATH domain and coiled-coil domain-containing protein At3g58270-like [Vigna radiata var. radiata]|uniref:MATH domain and coiled-coil domain-containing protein At3g58270-like n=1 Tax=Vigna radiata var. radiata TaxID=3916 RepID=A0A1S3UZ53_VIGRR|nr:MATH domain and coiled-coil domain-containing protein At3g58270-like [Vigna radiata var. radiata]
MENQNTKDKMFQKFTWTLTNFSMLGSKELFSETFSLDGHTWRIFMFPKGDDGDFLSIYLDAGVDTMPHRWEKIANFKLIVINQLNDERNIIKESSHTFNSEDDDWDFTSDISLDELCDSNRGFILNDTCIIEVHIVIDMLEHEKQVDVSERNIDNIKLVESIENRSSVEMISTQSFGEVVDFRSIGKVEKDFIPLLEDVCSRYPSLLNSKKRRSQKFIEWALTALGRVLYFLNTKKVRDMDDDACNHLQILWEELETVGFDLSWLKPHVQSALGMKSRIERVLEVKRLEEKVISLEEKTKALRTEMIEAELNLEITRRELVKAKEDFENCDLDAKLSYGKPSIIYVNE